MFECSQGEITVSENNGRSQTSIRIIFVRPRKQVLHGHYFFLIWNQYFNVQGGDANNTRPSRPALKVYIDVYKSAYTSFHVTIMHLQVETPPKITSDTEPIQSVPVFQQRSI